MAVINHKAERGNDVKRVKDSGHSRKVVAAGPGTGKSYLFSEIIKQKRAQGKTKFLAITFIGKLSDALADDLCGLARTTTMHSFARSFVLEHAKGWTYYPQIYDLIAEDLKNEGVEAFEIGDEHYVNKTKYYKAVGDADVVHYAVRICKKDPKKIPVFDLILVDEYQDFNAAESEFVDLLAQRNETIIVGDDDQALYGFKGSSPSFIREKYDSGNTNWESFSLRFCSRCTEVMIKYFHSLVAQLTPSNPAEGDPSKRRIEKEYICYAPDGEPDSKTEDSKANPTIHLIKSCPVGMIAYKIKEKLEKLVETQKVKEVLVIGEARSCMALLKTTAQQLKNYGFKNVDNKGEVGIISVRQSIVDAYRFLAKDGSSLLGWRILGNPSDEEARKRSLKNAKTLNAIINGTPSEVKAISYARILLMEDEIESWETLSKELDGDDMDASDVEALKHHEQDIVIRKGLLTQELKRANLHLPPPLCNLEITVCNILNSKGLGADVVFLIGFDQGKFPSKGSPTDDEIYQMMVAVTRAKKRMYLINTIDKKVSGFIDCLDARHLDIEEIKA
jgi:superfamily I DNA/RNA helicase